MSEFRTGQIEALELAKQSMVDSFDRSIAAIKEVIADAEVTYSIGDRFKNTCGGVVDYEMLLCKIYDSGKPKVTLISFDDYVSYGAKSFYVDDFKKITQPEMDRILFRNGNFITRTWDNRKQQKVSE